MFDKSMAWSFVAFFPPHILITFLQSSFFFGWQNGLLSCKNKSMDKCPPLPCPADKHIRPHDQCCPICDGTDFCSQGHSCGQHSTCVNLKTNYTCVCDAGYRKNASTARCDEIDECNDSPANGGGHNCTNAKCVNTPGSYRCQCDHGFTPVDLKKCIGKWWLPLALLLTLWALLKNETGGVGIWFRD